MTALSIQPPFPIITDIDGQPLEDGYIWIGTAGLNPIGNPISVYWDAALSVPAALPVRTRGGYPMRSGTPARLYVNSDYSLLVQNKNGSTVYSALTATERLSGVVVEVDATDVTFIQAGTGAVTRTAQAKMRETVSVLDFGAVGDGVADDTAAIQAAINALVPYQALNVTGNFKITSGLNITNKSNIRITGGGTIFLSGAPSNAYIFLLVGTVSNLEIDHLTLIGDNNSGYSQGAIGANAGQTISNTNFHDLNVSNINVGISHNAYPTGTWNKGVCYNNAMSNLVGSGAGQGYGIHMSGATNIRVYGNVVDNASRHGIYQGSGTNCNNVIYGNQIVNHRASAFDATYKTAINCSRSSGVTIANNRVMNGYDGGLEVSHENSTGLTGGDIIVTGNSFTGRQNNVPYILVGQQAVPTVSVVRNVEITGNLFNSAAIGGAFATDIYIANGAQLNIQHNTFYRTGVGASLAQCIEMGDSSFATSDAHISDIVVKNNLATADAAVAGTRFAYISTRLCTGSSPYTLKDNTFNGWANEFEFQATPTNVNSKLKFSVSYTFDFASIPANSGTYIGVAVNGVKATSSIVGRPQHSTITGNVVFWYYAQSTNNAEILAANVSTGAQDPASQTFLLFIEDI
jgi:hypothetical protein